METLIEERTLLVEVEADQQKKISLELALPFFGKVPNERRWIRITKDDPPQVTTINITSGGCDVFEWAYPEYADIQDFVPCSFEDWIDAKYAAAGYCINLKNR